MQTEVLRIIEGGLANDKRKILTYSTKLADRLEREGDKALSKCIRQKLLDGVPQNAAVADAMRMIPLDQDSRLQIVEVKVPRQRRSTFFAIGVWSIPAMSMSFIRRAEASLIPVFTKAEYHSNWYPLDIS